MRKEGFIGGLLLAIISILLFVFTVDGLSMLILGVMYTFILVGFIVGIIPLLRFSKGFSVGRTNIKRLMDVETDNVWLLMKEEDRLFSYDVLNKQFSVYKEKAYKLSKENEVICDIEEYINEDVIAVSACRGFTVQIANTLIGLGVLGTLLGILLGLGKLSLTSIDSVAGSIKVFLVGIRLAFYTSICGVILSTVFNLIYQTIWEIMTKEMSAFFQDFHLYIIPTPEEQQRQRVLEFLKQQKDYQEKVLESLEKARER